MPTVNVSGVGTVNFPDGMSQAAIIAAIENDILPNAAKYSIQGRAANPPDARFGDPNGNAAGITGGDVGKAALAGTAHLAGLPANSAEIPQAVKDWALNVVTGGMAGPSRMAVNAVKDVTQGRVPVVGDALSDVAAPAVAYAHGNAPTHEQNMRAMESGTSLAEMAALQHPAVGAAIGSGASKVGAAMEASGTPPLTESIGSLVAQKGRVINPTADIEVPKFNNAARQGDQLTALTEKYPNSDIMDKGDSFVVKAEKAAASTPAQASKVASGISDLAGAASSHIKASTVGGGLGFLVGGPPGAAAGAAIANTAVGAVEAAQALRSMMRSPLWKATSGALKTEVGRAMQAQDFSTVAAIGSRVLAGENLDDKFGHDSALHGLIDSITQHGTVEMSPTELHQVLQDFDAIYVNPDGSAVAVPYDVQRRTANGLAGH